jgi:hypothetical protein
LLALSPAFGRTAMRRWDRLLDSYLEEYRARGVSSLLNTVKHLFAARPLPFQKPHAIYGSG